MIKLNINDIIAMHVNGLDILAVYMRGRLIWALPKKEDDEPKENDNSLSCFYNGYWIDEYPWTDDTPWID